ncbi:ribonuclease H-like protein [Dothidotthia symphoricarpi CBS 119687]|uniref:ribonuclease H n=1 Tax=Dothidotthia symphoricarpi CBS 119687 TaxID=1392245 RepID=A0A6A6AUY4_9PLEO|nr:ribonuclease H-like protein [Dothidotthia symphoricarpi CBS 119687]KAF2134351.1 ribonuclease H-like protein [Dothidotthia symphoricarpi CBS 119687]
MDTFEREFLVVPDGVLPEGVGLLLGGQNHQSRFPPLDPASNFTRFLPPNATDTPETLFMPGFTKSSIPAPRFTRQSNLSEFLIYTDGACSENGDQDARGGCAFVYRPETSPSMIPFRLESRSRTGEAVPQTSNRAELRAVIAALGFRLWNNEGCQRLVIATDSSYVVDGSTEWIKKWKRNGWQTSTHKPVKNQDLWKELVKALERWSEAGVAVLFWLIPRKLNTVADRLAKEATALTDEEDWVEIQGVLC